MRWPPGGPPAGVATAAAASSETTGMLVPHRGQKYTPEPTLVPQRVQNVRPATVIERSRLVTGDLLVAAQISRRRTARQLSIPPMRLSGLSPTPRSPAGGPPPPPPPPPRPQPPPRPAPLRR